MLETIIGTLIFTFIILLLVAFLAIAEKYLVNSGAVTIGINGDADKGVQVAAGSTLLSTLADHKIFIPSACGGGGTCAQCKCVVTSGGGDILPTEIGHLSRSEQKEGVRLSCQVKVKSDMEIEVPAEIFEIKKFKAKVLENPNVATFIKAPVLELEPGVDLDFKAGGYIQIQVPKLDLKFNEFDIPKEYSEDWEKYKLYDLALKTDEPIERAYSMANHPAEGNRLMFTIRIATPPPGTSHPPGICSSYVFNLKEGDEVELAGPFGEFFINDSDSEMVYVGGGAGMAPMRSHIFDLFHTKKTNRKVSFWYGARSVRENFFVEDFESIQKDFPNFSYNVAMSDPLPEDNWTGPTGFIHQVLLENYLKDHPDPTEIEYYLCGPPMMIDAVTDMLYDLGVESKNIRYDAF
jgi:Na+-transporting NADH:ubiquinone oxidoreductase subunit F